MSRNRRVTHDALPSLIKETLAQGKDFGIQFDADEVLFGTQARTINREQRPAHPREYRAHAPDAKLPARARIEKHAKAIRERIDQRIGDRLHLQYAEIESNAAFQSLESGNIDELLLAFERMAYYMVAAGIPWLDEEAFRRRQGKRGSGPKSTRKEKAAARALWKKLNPRPDTPAEWGETLDNAGIPHTKDQRNHWIREFREEDRKR